MQKIRIDFDNPGLPQHISAVENDSQSRFFQAMLYENGKAYTAPEGATYSIMYRGFGPQNQGWYDTINDGAGKRAACAVSGNVVTCEIARQALQVPGHVSIVLCVTTGKGYMLKSWPIECDCKNDRYDSTVEIQSFFYVTQISNESWTQAIQAVEELKNTIDPTLSLSGKAADAKATGDAVGELKEDILNCENSIYYGQYTFKQGYILNGLEVGAKCDYKNIIADANFECTVVTNIAEGTKFHIMTSDGNTARAYSWLDSEGNIVFVPAKNSALNLTQIMCPQNASILVVNLRKNTERPIAFYRDDSIKSLTNAINSIDLSKYVEKDGHKQVTANNCKFFITGSSNKCNPDEILWDKAINGNGDIVDATGLALTDYIEVTDNWVFFAVNFIAKPSQRISLYDADKIFKTRVTGLIKYQVDRTLYKYIRVQFSNAVNTDNFYVGFYKSETDTPSYDTYSLKIDRSYLYDSGSQSDNQFSGLSAVAFGTSLTARAYEDHKYDNTTYGYLTYLRQYSGMKIDNQGIGGATILSDSADKSIYTAITNYTEYANKQVCVLEGFVNDWYKDNENTLGTYSDTSNNTVCGRLRNAITHILAQNPNITLFVILDHYGKVNGSEDFSSNVVKNGYTIYQYFNELSRVCKSMSVFCIKEYELSGISELAPQYLADYIHLNDLGAKQSATAIWNKMKQYSIKK